jgi:hypothetical protein
MGFYVSEAGEGSIVAEKVKATAKVDKIKK